MSTKPMDAAEGAAISDRHRYYILAVLTTVYIFNFIDRQILVILQDDI